MIAQEKIDEMKKNGEVILTSQTFKKSVIRNNDGTLHYKGKTYSRHDWILTYGHKQYERLIP